MSRVGAALLRALLARAAEVENRIRLVEIRSTDWQSLTFDGERHVITLRIDGAGAARTLERLTGGVEEHEFSIVGQIVADIVVVEPVVTEPDGSLTVTIEALTVAE
jgi:hypothetical protein